MNLNKVFLIGRLTADPELRSTSSGQSVGSFSIATNRYWTNKSGERQEDAQFHNIVVWGRQSEIANQFLKKGSVVFIEGRLQTRVWQDREGKNRRTTEVVCEQLQLGPRPSTVVTDLRNEKKDKNKSQEDQPKEEEKLPEINIDDEGGEIKAEDIPF